MDRTIEIGQAGLQNTEDRFQALMQGVSNAQTPGYRHVDVVSRSFPLELSAAQERLYSKNLMKPVTEGIVVGSAQGTLQPTGHPMDFALDGQGYFVLQAPWGQAYTRDGRFSVSADGLLIYKMNGWPVLGETGPIMVPSGAKLDISGSGVIRVDGEEIDRLHTVIFQNPSAAETVNGVILRPSEGQDIFASQSESIQVLQGFVEQSNVETIRSSMELLFLARLYQYDTRILQVRDQLLGRAMDLARPAQ